MASKEIEMTSGESCSPPAASDARRDRRGWLMAIPVIGVLVCCGGPLVGAWLVSAGLLAVVGSWWVGVGHWIVLGLALVGVGGTMAWVARHRTARG